MSSCSIGRSRRSSLRRIGRLSGMGLCDEVRRHCATVAAGARWGWIDVDSPGAVRAGARWVSIDVDSLGAVEPGPPPVLDRARHHLDGPPEDVAMYMLVLDAVN